MNNRNDRLLSRSLDNRGSFWILRTMSNNGNDNWTEDIGEILVNYRNELFVNETRVYFNRGNKICFEI